MADDLREAREAVGLPAASSGQRAAGRSAFGAQAGRGRDRAAAVEAARILIVRLVGTGDVVHALPVLHALRARFPESQIDWLVGDSSAALLEGHPEITRLHVIPEIEWRRLGWWKRRRRARELRETLHSQEYSVVIDLESSPRSARLVRATGADVRIGYAPPAGRQLSPCYHTHRIFPGPRHGHAVERNMSLLVPLGVSGVEPRFVYPDLSEAGTKVVGFADGSQPGHRPVVLHPGAEWPSSRWPVEHFAELARRIVSGLGMPVVVTALGEIDRPRAQAVAHEAGDGALVSPATGVREFAAFVRQAALFVGGDAAAMHVAWTSGTPTVAVLGPTAGTGRDPLGPRSRSIDAGFGCVGCGRPSCPDGPPRREGACMRGVMPEAVFDLAREVLQ